MARLITKNELVERFDLALDGPEWVEKQRSFLKQAVTACLMATTQDQCREALVQLLGSIVNDQEGGFDAELVKESASLLTIIQPPALTICDSVKEPLEAAVRSIAKTDAIGNLVIRFPMHGAAFLQAAEARLQEFTAAWLWYARVSNFRTSLAPRSASCPVEELGAACAAFDGYVSKPEYRELLKASMPEVAADCEATAHKVLHRLYKGTLARWTAFVRDFMDDEHLLPEESQGQADALGEACRSLPSFGVPEIDALVAKFGMIAKWFASMKSGGLALVLRDAEMPVVELRDMQHLAEVKKNKIHRKSDTEKHRLPDAPDFFGSLETERACERSS